MKDVVRQSLLLDSYGNLLTEKQRVIYDWYYQQDLSLGEIADLQQVSRNAVYDLLSRTEEKLEHYEQALGLLATAAAGSQIKLDLCQDWQIWQIAVGSQLTPGQQVQLSQLLLRLEQL